MFTYRGHVYDDSEAILAEIRAEATAADERARRERARRELQWWRRLLRVLAARLSGSAPAERP